MAYLKRQSVPKTWPIARKGTTYVIRPNDNLKSALPVLVILRDILGIVQNRKEAKRIIQVKQILLNGKKIKSEKDSVQLFDIVTIIPSKKNYRLIISENKKFDLAEIGENETGNKIAKVINKKVLKGKKTQLNLSDGRNVVSDIKCNIGDSLVINFASKKIEKCLPLENGHSVLVFSGKHMGETGVIDKIDAKNKTALVKNKKETIHVLIKQIIMTR